MCFSRVLQKAVWDRPVNSRKHDAAIRNRAREQADLRPRQ
jgi:hypothetical protein